MLQKNRQHNGQKKKYKTTKLDVGLVLLIGSVYGV
jgi:hypothetical protein